MPLETVNVAVVAPAGTVTLAGTSAVEASLLESATDVAVVAAAVNVTVPWALLPLFTAAGLMLSEARLTATARGITVSVAV